MAKRTCSIEGCDLPSKTRGWCNMHYLRWWANGDTGEARPRLYRGDAIAGWFWSRVDKRGPDECWPWTGTKSMGYGRFRRRPAHVIAYELAVGPIPAGLVIDHTCHNADASCSGGTPCPHRACCNPAHLEAVTHAVNRARGRLGDQVPPTHCKRGHPLSGDNLYVRPNGARQCRACLNLWKRENRHRKREAVVK